MDSPERATDDSTMADSTLQPPPSSSMDDGTLASEALDDDDAPIAKEDVAPFEIGDEDEESGPLEKNQHSLPNPEELKATQPNASKGCFWMLCWMITLCVIILVLSLGLALGLKNRREGKNFFKGMGYKNFSPVARSDVEVGMKKYIVGNGVSSDSDFAISTTPQSVALNFLANKDPMKLNAPLTGLDTPEGYAFITRYVMAVFYAAMNGDYWNYDLLFMSKHATCEWYNVFEPPVGQVGVLCNKNTQNTQEIVGMSFSKWNGSLCFRNILFSSWLPFSHLHCSQSATIWTERCHPNSVS